ncbi:Pycsar system effector family protein [Algivirga pacifica]|uniref:HD domain-containing protein n=1 Tax=Algivirga pacifica TaxID=1162670 RepID=A0ABP9CY12_9BACT
MSERYTSSTIIDKASSYVRQFFKKHEQQEPLFHDFTHTADVVHAIEVLCREEDVSDKVQEQLIIAAWFHDVGYFTSLEVHELASVEIAKNFLEKEQVSQDYIQEVSRLIMATQLSHAPEDLSESIIKDADLQHLGSKQFQTKSQRLFRELQQNKQCLLSPKEWIGENIRFLKEHAFHTSYAKQHWNPIKEENINALYTLQEQLQLSSDVSKKKKKAAKKEKKKKKALPTPDKGKQPYGKGVETMFRIMAQNHMTLSEMADKKANMMISVNSMIISLIFYLIYRAYVNELMFIPTSFFAISSLTSIVFAVLATRPQVMKGRFKKEEVLSQKVNMLFFGNFHNTPLEDYTWAMKQLMANPDHVYEELIHDIHSLGQVLAGKYRMLRISYTVFMWGVAVSVGAFLVTLYFS